MIESPDVEWLEAIVRTVFGTDTKCRLDRCKTDAILADAERKVERLQQTLDASPAKNLDEAIKQMVGE